MRLGKREERGETKEMSQQKRMHEAEGWRKEECRISEREVKTEDKIKSMKRGKIKKWEQK